MSYTKKDMLKEVKQYAREIGLVFRQSKTSNLYVFHDFKTKEVVLSNCTLSGAYENMLSGYLSSYNKDKRLFDKRVLEKLELI